MNSERYMRQGMVPEFGDDGQQKLEDASVLIIGAGAIGSTLMYNLAASGIGTIGVADHSIVKINSLNAQYVHFEDDIGTLKVISATRKLKSYNSMIHVIPHATAINKDNAYEIISQYDIVALCVTNSQTQMIVNEACVELGKPFVVGTTNGFAGTCAFILPQQTPCLACFYGKEIPPEDNFGTISAVTSTIASFMSTAILQYLLETPVALEGKLFYYDSIHATIEKIDLSQRHDCSICGPNADWQKLDDGDLEDEEEDA